jgi:hypothetical protein
MPRNTALTAAVARSTPPLAADDSKSRKIGKIGKNSGKSSDFDGFSVYFVSICPNYKVAGRVFPFSFFPGAFMSDHQCSRATSSGMCNRPRVDGSAFCEKHSNEAARTRSYHLSNPDLAKRFDQLAGSDSIRTVKEEVIMLRLLIEDRHNLARTEAERVAAFQVLTPAFATLAKLVEVLNKLERSTDTVLEKEAVDRLGGEIVNILIEELCSVENYTDIVDRVAGRIGDAISNARNN